MSKNLVIYIVAGAVVVGLALLFLTGSSGEQDETSTATQQCDGTNLVINGSFEALDDSIGAVNRNVMSNLALSDFTWDVFNSLPSEGGGTSWLATEGIGIELQYDPSGDPLIDGSYVVELDSSEVDGTQGLSNSAMSQELQLTEGTYDLSFAYRARTDVADDNIIDVLFDGEIVHTQNSVDQNWQEVAVDIGALSAGSHTLGFRASGIANTTGGLIDNVVLSCSE